MISGRRFLVVYLLLALVLPFANRRLDLAVPVDKPLAGLPAAVGEWRMVSESLLSQQVLDTLRPTDYLCRTYQGADGASVRLYVGYHGGGEGGGEIHSPRHCLPGNGWQLASSGKLRLPAAGGPVDLVRAVYRKGELQEVFYYWFQVRQRTLADEYALKLAQLGNALLHRRRDAAFVRISVPVARDETAAAAAGARFVKDFYRLIAERLPG